MANDARNRSKRISYEDGGLVEEPINEFISVTGMGGEKIIPTTTIGETGEEISQSQLDIQNKYNEDSAKAQDSYLRQAEWVERDKQDLKNQVERKVTNNMLNTLEDLGIDARTKVTEDGDISGLLIDINQIDYDRIMGIVSAKADSTRNAEENSDSYQTKMQSLIDKDTKLQNEMFETQNEAKNKMNKDLKKKRFEEAIQSFNLRKLFNGE